MTVESTDCLVLPWPVLTTITSIPYPTPTPQLWDKDLVAPLLFWENFWTYRPQFLHLQNGNTNQLSFACIMRISWKKGTWSLFVSSFELCISGAPFLSFFPSANLQRTSLVFKSLTETGEETGVCRGEWLSKAPEWIGVLGSCPVLSNSTIQCKLDLSMPETYLGGGGIETSGRVSPFEALEGAGKVSGAVAAAGVEIPVRVPLCPAVTSYLGIWVLGESTGLWPRGPVVLGSGWDESEGKTALSRPQKLHHLDRRERPLWSSVALLTATSRLESRIFFSSTSWVWYGDQKRYFFCKWYCSIQLSLVPTS